jgi:hypothetical protein
MDPDEPFFNLISLLSPVYAKSMPKREQVLEAVDMDQSSSLNLYTTTGIKTINRVTAADMRRESDEQDSYSYSFD